MTKKFDEIVLREREKSFHISRIPIKTKEEIIKFAEEEFAGDYGMCIHFIFEKFKEMVNYQNNFDIKLNYIIQMLENKSSEPEKKESSSIRMLDGNRVKGGIKKNE